jgi:hypothetical protein
VVTGPLRERGHQVVAPELPSEDTKLGLEDYADTIENGDPGRRAPNTSGREAASACAPEGLWAPSKSVSGRSYWGDRDATTSIMYGDLAAADADWAFEHLRPQAQRSQSEPCLQPPAGLRVESIIGTKDRVASPDWSRRVAREHLGVEPGELPTGHFPMIRHPQLLVEALARIGAG